MANNDGRRIRRIDIALAAIAVSFLIAALWIWIVALPIEREVIFIATTIALVISLVLVVNALILLMLRLQRRISSLEEVIAKSDASAAVTQVDSVVVVTLTNTERRVINCLEENGGSMLQDELRRATGLSKSTLSVAVASLERKSLIQREANGRTKTVSLKRKIAK